MPTDLSPGTITTLGALRPGDVGVFSNNPDGGKFVVTDVLPSVNTTWIQYQHDTKPHARYSEQVVSGGWKVRYLGRGRTEPARIVMDGETDRIAELEAQVRLLREVCEKSSAEIRHAFRFGSLSKHDAGLCSRAVKMLENAVAATAPKGEPCTT